MRDDIPQVQAQRVDEQVIEIAVPASAGQPSIHREHEVAQGSHATGLASLRLTDYRKTEFARQVAK